MCTGERSEARQKKAVRGKGEGKVERKLVSWEIVWCAAVKI